MKKLLTTVAIAGLAFATLTGCEEKKADAAKDTTKKVGEAVKDTTKKVGEDIKEGAKDVKDAVKPAEPAKPAH